MKRDLCVFVVDDMPLIAYTVSCVLRDEGHSAIPYTDSLLARRDARSFKPDVLISDVEMPNVGGIDLAFEVVGMCPHCKVFLMSGQTGPIKRLEEARTKGFHFRLFEKPLSARMLADELELLRVEQPGPLCGKFERVGTAEGTSPFVTRFGLKGISSNSLSNTDNELAMTLEGPNADQSIGY